MNDKRLTEMSGTEFDSVIEAYIDRESQNMGEINAPLFYEALEEILASEPAVVELEGQIAGSQLQLHTSSNAMPGVRIHDNEIVVNNIRFVIHMTQKKNP